MWRKQEANYYKELEFGKTTVYKRRNPIYYNSEEKEVTKEEFDTLEEGRVTYEEKQLNYREYYMELERENKVLKMQNDSNSSLIDFQEEVLQDVIFTIYS